MKLPKSIKIGKTRYAINLVQSVPGSFLQGQVNYQKKRIVIGRRSSKFNITYTQTEREETFWHELTHAILYDMGDQKNNNEVFVTKFSSRLAKAIRSAEL